jgi:kynureninase
MAGIAGWVVDLGMELSYRPTSALLAPVTMNEFAALAIDRDQGDPLNGFREAFTGLEEELLYLDGNSLGCLPCDTADLLRQTISKEWGRRLIQSWNDGWYDLAERLGNELAPLIGAGEGEVCFTDSVTVNLFKLAGAVLNDRPGRKRIVTDDLNFPSDYYALDSLIGLMDKGHELVRVSSPDGLTMPLEVLAEAIDEQTALVTVSHVVFKSGFLYNLRALCEAAHAKGAMVLVDLSHSVGAVPIDLEGSGVDLAVGCAYKYLNGGPGAPAFLYVRKSLQERLIPALAGWFGARDPFAFNARYSPANGIRRFMTGTPPILSLRAVEPGIQLLRKAGMTAVREKSVGQSEFFLEMWEALLQPLGFKLGSPRDVDQRGSHISLQHPEAYRINRALIEPPDGRPVVIPDFRTPDNLRIGIAPLFLRYADLVRAVERMVEIVETREYERFSHEQSGVT